LRGAFLGQGMEQIVYREVESLFCFKIMRKDKFLVWNLVLKDKNTLHLKIV
jgi:hypothetical protein